MSNLEFRESYYGKDEKVKAYKGFNNDMTCRGKQYEIGGEYEEEQAKVCFRGMHSCINPMEVLRHYRPCESRFCEVEASGQMDCVIAPDENIIRKMASTKLRVVRELDTMDLIISAKSYLRGKFSRTFNSYEEKRVVSSSEPYSEIINHGFRGVAVALETSSIATNLSDSGTAVNIISGGLADNMGNRGVALTSGTKSIAFTSASNSTAVCISSESLASSEAIFSTSVVTGNYDRAQTLGDSSVAFANGVNCMADVQGEHSVAVALGMRSKAKGIVGSWLVLSECGSNNDNWKSISNVRAVKVDGEKIKPDTYYRLCGGDVVEVLEDDSEVVVEGV